MLIDGDWVEVADCTAQMKKVSLARGGQRADT